jgi:DNA-binding transcriptional ArsR family regulator
MSTQRSSARRGFDNLGGDVDLMTPASLIGDKARAAILTALVDGRALPASTLAAEAGVAPSTASGHLALLVEGRLLCTREEGRNRYYELASLEVAQALETLCRIAPPAPVRSLRAGTRAAALRFARTCYDHVAGTVGIAVMRSLLDRGVLVGGDGQHRPAATGRDRLASPGHDVRYEISEHGWEFLDSLGVVVPSTRRPLIGYCVDWTEQRHHLAGRLGASLLRFFEEQEWVVRGVGGARRALKVTGRGRTGFAEHFDVDPSTFENSHGSRVERGGAALGRLVT